VRDFVLPDLGEGLEQAEVIAWRVQVGERVTVDQVVAEVETAKATVELPIPFSGVVTALHAEPGGTVLVGAPLISVQTDAEEVSGSVLIGYGTTPESGRGRRVAAQTTAGQLQSTRVPVISPPVRKLARDAGLDLALITGTGPDGLILRSDVEQAIAVRRPVSAIPAMGAHRDPVAQPIQVIPVAGRQPPAVDSDDTSAGERRVPFRGSRKATAEKLARSRREIPEATVWVDADATALLETRAALNARTPEHPVSVLALLARFALAGLRLYPELNAHIDGDDLVIPAHVHLGFAAQTDRGLVVPVIRNAHTLSTGELSSRLAQCTAAARSGQLAPADLSGGTFTVNNYGIFGVDGSAAIINHPEVAILGMGRIIDRPWVVNGEIAIRKVTELTLAFDHRACDGATAGGYLRYVADCIQSPIVVLSEL